MAIRIHIHLKRLWDAIYLYSARAVHLSSFGDAVENREWQVLDIFLFKEFHFVMVSFLGY